MMEAQPPDVAYRHSPQQKYSTEEKLKLVDSFRGFSGNTVSGNSIELARKCIQYRGSPRDRYQYIRFDYILDLNRDVPSYLTMMTSAYDLLLKYVINLLKNKRPQVWRSIKTNNTAFKARVSCMNGSTDILKAVGYTEERVNAMCFPDEVDEPDKDLLCVIAAELLMAKLEVEQMNEGTFPNRSAPKVRTMLSTSQPQNTCPPQRIRTDLMYTSSTSYQQQHTYQNADDSNSAPPRSARVAMNEPQELGYGAEFRDREPSHHSQYTSGYSPHHSGQVDPPVSSGPPQSHPRKNQDSFSWVPPTPSSNGIAMSPGVSNNVEPYVSSGNSITPESTVTGTKRPIPKPRTNIHKLRSDNVSQTPPPSQSPHHTPCPQLPEEDVQSSLGSHRSSSGELSTSRQSSISSADGNESSSSRPNSATVTSSVSSSVADRVKSIRERREIIKKGLENKSDTSFVSSPMDSREQVAPSGRIRSATEFHMPVGRSNHNHSLTMSPELSRRTAPGHASLTDFTSRPAEKGFKRPPSKKQPNFYNDPILEFPEVSSIPEPQRKQPLTRIPPQQPLHQPMDRPAVEQRQHQIDRPAVEQRQHQIDRPAVEYRQPMDRPAVEQRQQIDRPAVEHRQQQIDQPTIPPRQPQQQQIDRSAVEGKPGVPERAKFCAGCKNKLGSNFMFCAYCGKSANSSNSQPTLPDPPPSSMPGAKPPEALDNPPLRASHQDALMAEEHHRTRIIQLSPEQSRESMVTQPFTPVPREIPQVPSSFHSNQSEPPQPELPPKPRPRQDQKHVQPAPSVPPRQTTLPEVTRPSITPASSATPSLQTTPPLPPKQRSIAMVPQKSIVNHGEPAAAAGGTSELSSFLNMPGIAHLKAKEEAYKKKQRDDGVKEEDLKPLDEFEKAKRKFDKQRQDQAPPPPVKQPPDGHSPPKQKQRPQVDPRNYKREDLSKTPAGYQSYDPGEVKRLEELGDQGRQLLDAIKECTRWGYSLDEVQIAFNSRGHESTLEYLRQEWRNKTEEIQTNLSRYTSDGHGVGTPDTMETREALTKAGGNTGKAEIALFNERKKRVNELLGRVQRMREVDNNIDLQWEKAVQVLSANYMDVDMAFYSLQCDWLQPLYEYIFDESKTNVTVHAKEMQQIKDVVTRKDLDQQAHLRLLMTECRFDDEEIANIVLQLLEEVEGNGNADVEYPLQYYVDAAKDHKELDKARNFLIKECNICLVEQTIHEFVPLPGCEHSVCKECFKAHFTHVIKEKEVKHFTCPECGKPDMANEEITQGIYLEIFVQLIHQHLEDDMYKLCLEKLRDFNLIKEQNFIWCANNGCRSGFIHEGVAVYVQCPHCSKLMCRKCKKPWEPTHEGISCEEFARWKIDNDPNAQEQGLAAHLHANGIECPQCHFKYDLARGGCMHFKCIKCPNEFCSGCGQSFKQGQECGKLETCKAKGLHAHHPRDCLFYMRDFDVVELQGFLRKHNIPFDTEPKEKPTTKKETAVEEKPVEQQQEQPAAVVEPAAAEVEVVPEAVEPAAEPAQAQAAAAAPGCRVLLQKETMEGLKDEECGRDVVDGHAGLCETHYKEYLVDLINRNKLDPVTMYTTPKVTVMLTREEMAVPDRDDDDEDEDYREKLIQHVKEKLPLPNGNQEIGGGVVQANVQPVPDQPPPVVQPAPRPPEPEQ